MDEKIKFIVETCLTCTYVKCHNCTGFKNRLWLRRQNLNPKCYVPTRLMDCAKYSFALPR